MRNTAIKDKAEFEARQACFEFGDACRFVLDLVWSVKKSLQSYVTAMFKTVKKEKAPEQLKLNLMPWLESALIAY